MRFSAIALTSALLAGNALAAPRSSLNERIEARAAARENRSSHPIEKTSDRNLLQGAGTASNVEYSSNWAGAVRESPPSASATYTAVTATFTIPEPTVTAGSSGTYQAASAWVGIDGDTYTKAILQTGVDFYVYNGVKYYDAWYEWYPDYAYDFSIDVKAGDEVVAYVESTSPSKGVAVIENKTTGKNATKTLTAVAATATLGGQNAEWIVEDFESNGTQVAFVDFGSVTFTGATAQAGGSTYGLEDASLMEIRQNNTVLTEVTVVSDSELLVEYSG